MINDSPCTLLKTFTVDSLAVRVYRDQGSLAQDAARAARESIVAAIETKGSAAVILASATSQVRFLEALTSLDGIPWPRVTLFHMDEYLGVSDQHPASFRRFLLEHVLDRVQVTAFQSIQGDCLEPLDECERYSGLLRAQPIDLCCLGIGENGHIAFNDPPVADFADPRTVKLVKLDLACRQQQVGEGYFPDVEAVPKYAYTLTVPFLCSAGRLICVVPERRKAQAVRDTLKGPVSTACPASFLRQQPHGTLYLDLDSSSLA